MHLLPQFTLAAAAAMMLATPRAAQAQEAGDTCDTAGVITTDGTYNFDTTGASGNDPCFAGPPTVFYQWTAPAGGIATVDLCGSSFDTYLTVLSFTTCPADCETGFVAEDNDSCGLLQSSITFAAEEGTKYLFVVSGYDLLDSGPGVLNFTFSPLAGAPGESCADPIEITGSGSYPFDTTGLPASVPCRPPGSAASPTAWFMYEATDYGILYATSCGGGEATFESVLVAHLTDGSCPVDCSTAYTYADLCGYADGEWGLYVPLEPGVVVYFTVSGFSASDFGTGNLTVEIEPLGCIEAEEITEFGSYPFDTTGAPLNDPCAPGIPTAWFSYTATETQYISVDLCGTDVFDSFLTIYESDSCVVRCDSAIAAEDDYCDIAPLVVLPVVEGRTYYFAANGYSQFDFGEGVLNITAIPFSCEEALPIIGDDTYDYDNSLVLPGTDPCRPDSPTIWFSFVAEANGEVVVETCGLTGFDTHLSAFNGSCALDCDDLIVANDDFCDLQSRIVFPVVQGQTYLIAASGFSDEQGSGTFQFTFTPDEPLLVELESFSASAPGIGHSATIEWSTSSEIDNVGFHVNRVQINAGAATPAGRVNPILIPGQGSTSQGASYSLIDPLPVTAGEQRGYVLIDIDANGTETSHGPIPLQVGGSPSGEPNWSLY